MVTRQITLFWPNLRKCLILLIIFGYAAFEWSRGRGFEKGTSHLRGSQQKNADRGKGPYKPTLLLGFNYVYIQRKTR
ncbi:hypothetical protein LMORI2_22230 [Limnohabitans sp. MORI2]|nr:hypothetical protein LMORI2_22230 [Limnohabitans sp. MORI2]